MRFEEIDARIREAVDAVAATDPNPADPFRGLYISDDLARSLAHATPIDELDGRVALAAQALALGELDTEVLALCAAPELSPRYGRLLAYLHDDVTRKLASPRLVARLLAGEGRPRDALLARFAHDAPLRRAGALRLLDGDAPGPLADRLVKVPDRLAALLLGARLDAPAPDGRLRRVDLDGPLAAALRGEQVGTGQHGAGVEELRNLLVADSRLPVLVAGPDAPLLLAAALECGLVLLAVEALADPEVLADATLAARLEGRRLCFDHLERVGPADRTRLAHELAALHERPLLCAATREAALCLDEQTVMVVETALPGFAERVALWRALAGPGLAAGDAAVHEVAAKFRLSAGQIADACEVARLSAATRAAGNGGAPGAQLGSEDLHAGARQASSTRLGELATRLPPGRWPGSEVPYTAALSAWLSGQLPGRAVAAVATTPARRDFFARDPSPGRLLAAPVLAYRRERPGYPVLMRNNDLPVPVDLFDVRENALAAGSLAFLFPKKSWLPSPLLIEFLDHPRPLPR